MGIAAVLYGDCCIVPWGWGAAQQLFPASTAGTAASTAQGVAVYLHSTTHSVVVPHKVKQKKDKHKLGLFGEEKNLLRFYSISGVRAVG